MDADAWRTGVLTFDGNRKVEEKVTYECIRKHLQEVYGKIFPMAQWYSFVLLETIEDTKKVQGCSKSYYKKSMKGVYPKV